MMFHSWMMRVNRSSFLPSAKVFEWKTQMKGLFLGRRYTESTSVIEIDSVEESQRNKPRSKRRTKAEKTVSQESQDVQPQDDVKTMDEKLSLHSPLLQQYLQIKNQHKDKVLLFQVGDFYELYLDDAVNLHQLLELKMFNPGGKVEVPAAGFKKNFVDQYIRKLHKAGHVIGLCNQGQERQEAMMRKQGLIKRSLSRIITPGTMMADPMKDDTESNYLMAVVADPQDKKMLGINWVDISTGVWNVSTTTDDHILSEIYRIRPVEIIFPPDISVASQIRQCVKNQDNTQFETFLNAWDAPLEQDSILVDWFARNPSLATSSYSEVERSSVKYTLQYLDSCFLDSPRPYLSLPSKYDEDTKLYMDHFTRTSLELFSNMSSRKRKNTLASALDWTCTTAGSRMLKDWIGAPLTDKIRIEERLDFTEALYKDPWFCEKVRDTLKGLPDLNKVLQRTNVSSANAADLNALGRCITQATLISSTLREKEDNNGSSLVRGFLDSLSLPTDCIELADNLVKYVNEGASLGDDGSIGRINPGFDQDLDSLREILNNQAEHFKTLEAKLKTETGIGSLKIREADYLTAYCEIQDQDFEKIKSFPDFHYLRALRGSVRFGHPEIMDLYHHFGRVKEKAISLENHILSTFCERVEHHRGALMKAAESLSSIDILSGFATLARNHALVRPNITNGLDFDIRQGRHLVVEGSMLRNESLSGFIPNDCNLSGGKIWIVTGPNMGGKSTFLRQSCIIAILSHIGSFVPADSATVGIIDRIFCRLGSADDISSHRSTFYVEMLETATILNTSTRKSLVTKP
eukprot:TRINITY_DN3310_c0_g1_i21.p1 TRINITY_DN3310_c0_g1~~TRINITY_DN3310_c0_g1_i21.p1  ORF type:complete len:804 (-),score=134.16 TRINITY_DN3310_c0_g1_i21:1810-4221(-)